MQAYHICTRQLKEKKDNHQLVASTGISCFRYIVPSRLRIYKILGEAIRNERVQAGFSQEKLAEKANLTRNYIGQIERAEKRIHLETLAKIAKALGVRVRDLVDGI